jgi:predicted MPP superfamily phosphohydrolase
LAQGTKGEAVGAWRDRLYRALTRPPFTDATGRKGWLTPFARAPRHIVRQLDLAIEGWPRTSRPLRIAFLSDFHAGSHADDVPRLEAIVAETARHAPDLALYGGDFVNMIPFGGGRVPPRTMATILARLEAPVGRFAVLGNHDRNYGATEVSDALRANGIAVLFDSIHEVRFEGRSFDIAGIHDARRDRASARALLASLVPGRPTVVLAHDPWWFMHVPPGPHLMLAGHTHGGQICLPGIGPVRNASWAPLAWSHGLIAEQGRRMYVTSGLGCSSLPLRLGVAPEFVIINVHATE